MHGDVPSIVPRRNYDIRTQCLKGTCSSSELPGRWHVSLFLDAACPCRGCSSMFSPETSHGKTVTSPIIGLDPLFWFSPDRADDGVRTRDLLLGKQACCHCTTSVWPGLLNGIEPYPLRPERGGVLFHTWEPRLRCEGWDSNPRPPGYEPGELPSCSTPHGRAFFGYVARR